MDKCTFFSQPVAQTVVLWKSGKVVHIISHMPIWILIFECPKQVLNNTQLGIILFQIWDMSQ